MSSSLTPPSSSKEDQTHTAPSNPTHPNPQQEDQDVEDDLDDLDDVLDEFNKSVDPVPSAVHQPPPPTRSSASFSAAKQPNQLEEEEEDEAEGLDDLLSQEFAKELAQGMEALMKELGQQSKSGVDGEGKTDSIGKDVGDAKATPSSSSAFEDQFNEEELMKQFEKMMAGLGGGGGAASSETKGTASSSQTTAAQPASFQDAIKATMDKLKQSDASATASSSNPDPFAALGQGGGGADMASLLAALSQGGGGGEGDEESPELAKMLEGMMDELMSKEILYEPLKELKDKYPDYLSGPSSSSISQDERKRYEQQHRHVSAIVAVFEDPKYDPKNREQSQKVQDLMNLMQDCGSPPQEIVGDMPPEFENLGAGDENCTVM
ncbi:Pex19-domain-containing protein [Violaceomyces palustris]|uniref:Pex19-domain-containing protein n=1 Tax=Violaceomyces palustris TaxID=1673888 RepID=A0ACD0P2R4_9BASI|nr:Pex19-domain-containing protein [Violaceomyces palustris]